MYIIGNAYQKFSLDKILVIQQRSRHLGLSPATLLKKRLWHRCFLVSFAKILRNFFYKTSASEKKSIYNFTTISCNSIFSRRIESCSTLCKPLCYHISVPGSTPHVGHTNRSPYIVALLGQLSCPYFRSR